MLLDTIIAWAGQSPANQALLDARNDGAIAAALPTYTVIQPMMIGTGSVMLALGLPQGADLLQAMRSSHDPVLDEVIRLLDRSALDVGSAPVRGLLDAETAALDALMAGNPALSMLTGAGVVSALKALAEVQQAYTVGEVSAALSAEAERLAEIEAEQARLAAELAAQQDMPQ